MPADIMKKVLRRQEWATYVATSMPLATDLQRSMAEGPFLHFPMYHRLQYQAAKFMTEGQERADKKATDAIVMTWFKEASGRRVPYIGRAQLFIRVIPPWAAGSYEQKWDQALDVVLARWHDWKGYNQTLYGAPIVAKATGHETQGMWMCHKLVPVHIGLAPYCGTPIQHHVSSSLCQVLVRDVVTFKPKVSS